MGYRITIAPREDSESGRHRAANQPYSYLTYGVEAIDDDGGVEVSVFYGRTAFERAFAFAHHYYPVFESRETTAPDAVIKEYRNVPVAQLDQERSVSTLEVASSILAGDST